MKKRVLITAMMLVLLVGIVKGTLISTDKQVYGIDEVVNIHVNLTKNSEVNLVLISEDNVYYFRNVAEPIVNFTPKNEGNYLIQVIDAENSELIGENNFTVVRDIEKEKIEIITDKDIYDLGDLITISISEDLPSNYSVVVDSFEDSYVFLGEVNQQIEFVPKEPGNYSIKILDESNYVISLNDILVIDKQGIIGEEVNLTESINTSKNDYQIGEEVKIFFYNLNGSDYILNIRSSTSEFMYEYKGIDEISFTPDNSGRYNIDLLKNIFILDSHTFEVLENASVEEEIKVPIIKENATKLKKAIKKYNISAVKEKFSIKNSKLERRKNLRLRFLKGKEEVNEILENVGYDLEMDINDGRLKKIFFRNLTVKENESLDFGVDKLPLDIIKLKSKKVVNAFAIDPTELNFTNATLSVTASGKELWKCKDWNFTNQECRAGWIKMKDLIPGKEYNITITPDDPGFLEIIEITNAMHLDSNRNYIKNIYNEVRARDYVWVNIPANDYVRIEFERNLSKSNDITIVARSNSSGRVEVYEVNGTKKIADFGEITDNRKYKIRLSNLNGSQNTFDLRIVNSTVEFDYIVDPYLKIEIISYETATRTSDSLNLTISKPSNVQDGDVLFAFIALEQDNGAITEPSGWVEDREDLTSQGRDQTSGTYYKVITDASSEPEDYAWVVATAERWSGGIINLRNVDNDNPLDATTQYSFDTNWVDGSTPNPSIETNTNNAMVFACLSITHTVTDGAAPAGTTELWDEFANNANSFCANYTQTTAGPTGTRQWTLTGENSNAESHLYQIAFKPAFNDDPVVTLNEPGNGDTLYSVPVQLNFTVTDDDSDELIDSCILWTNFTGTWTENETKTDITNNSKTTFTISPDDIHFKWNVECEDNLGVKSFASSNYTATLSAPPDLTGSVTNNGPKKEGEDIVFTGSCTNPGDYFRLLVCRSTAATCDADTPASDIICEGTIDIVTNPNCVYNAESSDAGINTGDKATCCDDGDLCDATLITINDWRIEGGPVLTVNASDQGSSDLSPTTAGDNVKFNLTANDPNGDKYKIIVCDSNETLADSCADTTYCSSDFVENGEEASCTHNTLGKAGTYDWWAFACDNASETADRLCSYWNNGTSETPDASPFQVNNRPQVKNISANVSFAKSGDPIMMYTVNAYDADGNDLKIQCGDETGVYSLCESDFESGERNCTFSFPWTDNSGHEIFCAVNDSYVMSYENVTNITADNWIPSVTDPQINDSDKFVRKSDSIKLNITVSDSGSGVDNVSVANGATIYLAKIAGLDVWEIITTGNDIGCIEVDGNCTLQFIARDRVGNINDSIYYNVTIDDIAASVTNPEINDSDNILFSTDMFNLNITVTDTNNIVNVTVENNTNIQMYSIPGTNKWTVNTSALNLGCTAIDGICNLTFKAIDSVGNVNGSEVFGIKIDERAPQVSDPQINDTDKVVQSTYIFELNITASDSNSVINVTVENNTNIQMYSVPGTNKWTVNTSASNLGCSATNDICNLTFIATDAAGNVNNSFIFGIIVDDINPSATDPIINDSDRKIKSSYIFNLNVTVTDTNNIANVTVENNSNIQMFYAGSNKWTVNTSASNLGCTADDGICNLTFIATDAAGNINDSVVLGIEVDDKNPLVEDPRINDTDKVVRSTDMFELNITVTDTNNIANVTVENNSNIQMFYAGSNKWTVNTSASNLGCTAVNSACNLTFIGTDIVGNVNDTTIMGIYVDDLPPSITDINMNDSDNIVRSTTMLNISVTATDDNNVSSVTVNGTSMTQIGNTWFTVDTLSSFDCGEGICLLNFISTDNLGNINSSEFLNITVDDTEPGIVIVYPDDGYNTLNTLVEINFTPVDNIDTQLNCNVTINGTVNNTIEISTGSGNNTNYTASGFEEGIYYWNVSCWDDVPNINTSETRSFTVDLFSPVVGIESPANNTYESTTATIVFEYMVNDTATNIDNCSIIINNQVNGNPDTSIEKGTLQSFTRVVGEGFFNWSVNCTDEVGRVGASPYYNLTIVIAEDTTAPLIPLSEPDNDNYISNTNVNFTFTPSDYTGIDNCTIRINNIPNSTCNSWWNESFSSRKEITIRNVGNTILTDFPAYLNVSKENGMQIDFDDLRFLSDSCGETNVEVLDYELENFTSKKADVWIRIPTLSLGNNTICMYYNNSNAESGDNPYGVWDDTYKLVHHLDGIISGSGGIHNDSTQYGNNGTTSGGMNTDIPGIVAGADNFAGDNDYINCGNAVSLGPDEQVTISAWIYRTTAATAVIAGNGGGWGANGYQMMDYSNAVRFEIDHTAQDTSTISNDQWHYISLTYDGSSMKTYVDGTLDTQGADPGGITPSGEDFGIGYGLYTGYGGGYFTGIIDEVRVSNISRSDDWINQTYQLIVNQQNYVTFSGEKNSSNNDCMVSNNELSYFTINTFDDGYYEWNISCFDSSINSNLGNSSTRNFTIDTLNPSVIDLLSPSNGTISSQTTPSLTWEQTTETNFYRYHIEVDDDVNFGSVDYNFYNYDITDTDYSGSLGSDSSWYWRVNAIDKAANNYLTGWFNYTTDNTNPSVSLIAPEDDSWDSTGVVTFTYTASDSFLKNCSIWANFSGTWMINETNYTVSSGVQDSFESKSLPDGIYIWNVLCYDNASNFEWASNNYTIYVDTTEPSIVLSSPSDGYNTSSSSIGFEFTPYDNLADTIECNLSIDGNVNVSEISRSSGQSYSKTINNFEEGNHTWNVTCIDQANNTNYSQTRLFTIDLNAPIVNLEDPDNGTSFNKPQLVTFNYNVTDAATDIINCSLFINNKHNQSNTDNPKDTSLSFSASMDTGSYNWSVNCTDRVGRVGYSGFFVLTVQPPVFINVWAAVFGANLDRDQVKDTVQDNTTLIVHLSDGASGELVDFYANLTDPLGLDQTEIYLGTVASNDTGYANLTFNGKSGTGNKLFAGNYTWWAESGLYRVNTSSTFLIYGGLNLTFRFSDELPDPLYGPNGVARIQEFLKSTGPESDRDVNYSYMAAVNTTFILSNGTNFTIELVDPDIFEETEEEDSSKEEIRVNSGSSINENAFIPDEDKKEFEIDQKIKIKNNHGNTFNKIINLIKGIAYKYQKIQKGIAFVNAADNEKEIKLQSKIYDSKNKKIRSRLKFFNKEGILVEEVKKDIGFLGVLEDLGWKSSPTFKEDKYDVEFLSDDSKIKRIRFRNLSYNGNFNLGIDDISEESIRVEGKDIVDAYAINPGELKFSDANVTINASGNALYKCKDWNFTTRSCNGEWNKVGNLKRGDEYNITITADDPGFIEVIEITKAIHLDDNKEVIEDVYDKVRARDSIFTEIPSEHYIRVTFKKELTQFNDITIFAKSEDNARVEVYEKDSDVKIADFGNIKQDKKYQILLKNLEGTQDIFDLKVINGSVEFDYIVDPYYDIEIIDIDTNSVSASTSLTINKPSGIEDGDVLFAFIMKDGNTEISPIPSGWSEYISWETTAGRNMASGLYHKVVGDADSEPSSYTWESDEQEWSGAIWALRNVDHANPIDKHNWTHQLDTQDPTCYSLTTTVDKALVFTCVAMSHRTITTVTPPAGTTSQYEIFLRWANSFCSNFTQTSAGATGDLQWDTDMSNADADSHVYQIAIRPKANVAPNITLTNPLDTSTAQSTPIEFNFTVSDDQPDQNIESCTIWTNFTGSWIANESLYDLDNGTTTNFTLVPDDGYYKWNVICSDSFGTNNFSVNNFTVDVAAPADILENVHNNGSVEEGDDILFWAACSNPGDQFRLLVCNSSAATCDANTPAEDVICEGSNSYDRNATCVLTTDSTYAGTHSGDKAVCCDDWDQCDTTTETVNDWEVDGAPVINRGPSDHLSSTTYPTLAGNKVNFTIKATDPNGDNYRLIVCNVSSATFSGCQGGSVNQLCSDTNVASGDETSCNFIFTQGLSGNYNWWAFVCEESSPFLCSNAAQGAGLNGSPYYINSKPIMLDITSNQYVAKKDDLITITSVGAFDLEDILLSLICGNESGVYNLCTGSFGILERDCTFSYPWDDDISHTIYCVLNDSFSISFVNETSISADNTAPIITLNGPGNNTYDIDGLVGFNYTPVDSNLDSCQLWGNWTSTIWGINQTNTSPVNNQLNNFENITLTDGHYLWNVWCNDTLELGAFSDDNYTLKVDTLPPVITLHNPKQSDNPWEDSQTIDFEYEVHDIGTDIDTCYLVLNNSRNMTDPDGVVEYDPNEKIDPVLPDGDYNWSINCTDTNGFTGNSTTWFLEVRVANFAPEVSLIEPDDDTYWSAQEITLVYYVDDDKGVENCSLFFDGELNWTNKTITVNSNNNFSVSGLKEGYHNWSVGCYDNAEQYDSTGTSDFYVDISNPYVELKSPENKSQYTISDRVQFKYNVTDNLDTAIKNCSIYINDLYSSPTQENVQLNKTQTIQRTLSNQIITWYVECYDKAGNSHSSAFFNLSINSSLKIWNASIDLSTKPEGIYKVDTNAIADWFYPVNLSSSRNLTLDKSPPNITLISPVNDHNTTNQSVNFGFNSSDIYSNVTSCSLIIDNATTITNASITQIQNNFSTTLDYGTHTWSVNCTDYMGNVGNSSTRDINIRFKDLKINASDITISSGSPVEGESVIINATVYNIGDEDITKNFYVRFNVIDYLGQSTTINEFLINGLNKASNISLNTTWKFSVENNTVQVIADSGDDISESNENNNEGNISIFISAYHIFYGKIRGDILLDTSQNLSVISWLNDSTLGGNIFVTDSDSDVIWTSLQALTRNISNNLTINDLEEADLQLNLTNITRSLNRTYSFEGAVKESTDFEIYDSVINYTPITNSTNTSDFFTGVLWDTSDFTEVGFYNGSQDLIFVTKISRTKIGAYGQYDYEIKVPAFLRRYIRPNNEDSISFFVELT